MQSVYNDYEGSKRDIMRYTWGISVAFQQADRLCCRNARRIATHY